MTYGGIALNCQMIHQLFVWIKFQAQTQDLRTGLVRGSSVNSILNEEE